MNISKHLTIISVILFSQFSVQAQVENGLVAHFMLDGIDFTDETGTQDGVSNSRGNSTFDSTLDKTGGMNLATDFQGGIMEAGTNRRTITNEVSVSAWIRTSASTAFNQAIVSQYNCDFSGGYLLYLREGTVSMDIRDNSNKGYMTSGKSSIINDNKWHHVVGDVSSAGDISIWVDGQLASSNTYSTINSLMSGCGLAVGGLSTLNTLNTTGPFDGDIDEVRIYNRSLDSLEVDTLYQYPYTTASISSRLKLESIAIYPNPASNELHIDYLNVSKYDVSITDVIGKDVLRTTAKDVLDISFLTSGSYILTIIEKDSGQPIGTAKFIKN